VYGVEYTHLGFFLLFAFAFDHFAVNLCCEVTDTIFLIQRKLNTEKVNFFDRSGLNQMHAKIENQFQIT